MNNNTNNTSANRRRDIVTPAQRKAAKERKLAAQREAQEERLAAEKEAQAEKLRADEAKRREIEARRRSSVKTSSKAAVPLRTSMSPPPASAKKASARSERKLYGQQQQSEIPERRICKENERRSKHYAQHRRISELEYQIHHQQLIRDNMLDKDMEKYSPKSNKTGKIVAITVIAVLLILNIIVFSALTQRSIPTKNTQPTTPTTSGGLVNNDEQHGVPEIESPNDKHTVSASEYTNGTLILVNGEHPYDFDNVGIDIKDDELVTVAKEIKDKTYKAADYKVYLNRETVEMLNLMMADFYAYSRRDDVMVNSAHRTLDQQQDILDSKKKQLGEDQQIAQTPGNSEHHTGYAFDFSIYPANKNGSTFINTGNYTWIYENCHKYGFILRYPEGKTAITGIAPESWHFRYVGIPHATYMYQKGKTLEEYIRDIAIYSESIPLTINISDTESYSVFYVKKEDAAQVTFSVPKNTEYKISGDNVGGFVVWYNNADVGKKGAMQNPNVGAFENTESFENVQSDKNRTTQGDI